MNEIFQQGKKHRHRISSVKIIIFFFFYSLLMASCGPDIPTRYWDPMLIPYIDYIAKRLDDYNINSGPVYDILIYEIKTELQQEIIGFCQINDYYKSVGVDENFWNFQIPSRTAYPEYNKILILTHEIGHCAFGLGHSDNPQSIMYPFYYPIVNEIDFDNRWNIFIDEINTAL